LLWLVVIVPLHHFDEIPLLADPIEGAAGPLAVATTEEIRFLSGLYGIPPPFDPPGLFQPALEGRRSGLRQLLHPWPPDTFGGLVVDRDCLGMIVDWNRPWRRIAVTFGGYVSILFIWL